MNYSKEQVRKSIQDSKDFAQHVTECTKKYIKTLNLPTEGELSGFDFVSEPDSYTVNHTFIYKNEVKQCFYIIPLVVLWES